MDLLLELVLFFYVDQVFGEGTNEGIEAAFGGNLDIFIEEKCLGPSPTTSPTKNPTSSPTEAGVVVVVVNEESFGFGELFLGIFGGGVLVLIIISFIFLFTKKNKKNIEISNESKKQPTV